MGKAIHAVKKNIDDEFKRAIKEEAKNYEIINKEFVEDSRSVLIDWGCNAHCVKHLNISLKWDAYAGAEKCECPLGVKVYVSTPLGPEHINDEVDDDTFLTGKKKKKAPPPANLKIKFDTGGYIFIVVMVFLG